MPVEERQTKQGRTKMKKPRKTLSTTLEQALKAYNATDSASEVAVVLEIMRLTADQRQATLANQLRSRGYIRLED
jgi:hypothetical protein